MFVRQLLVPVRPQEPGPGADMADRIQQPEPRSRPSL